MLPEDYDPESDGGMGYRFEYDEENRLSRAFGPDGLEELRYESTCAYYADGALKSLKDVTGKTLCYVYDREGRLLEVKEKGRRKVAEYRYTPGGSRRRWRTLAE